MCRRRPTRKLFGSLSLLGAVACLLLEPSMASARQDQPASAAHTTTAVVPPQQGQTRQIAVHELLESMGLNQKEAVSESIIETMGILKGASLAQQTFEFGALRFDDADLYQLIQQKIASLIPEEYERPVIDVHFVSRLESPRLPAKTIGILGGIGPLSDAKFLLELAAKIKAEDPLADSYHVHLLSMPPPRRFADQALGLIPYMRRLRQFGKRAYPHYVMASNTAHINFGSYAYLIGSPQAYNLVEHNADMLLQRLTAAGSLDKKVLIVLGTTQAWEAKLYPNKLAKRGITVKPIAAADQRLVQRYIDRLKSGLPDEAVYQDFLAVFHKYHAAPHEEVVLACTELMLGLGDKIKYESDGQATFEGARVYDSEAMMIEAIFALQRALQ